jgi:hypothetical protein
MDDARKKNKTRSAVIAVLLIVVMSNYARHPHDGIRAVDFLQIMGMGILLGILLMRVIQAVRNN